MCVCVCVCVCVILSVSVSVMWCCFTWCALTCFTPHSLLSLSLSPLPLPLPLPFLYPPTQHTKALADTALKLREEAKRRVEAESLISALEQEEKDLIARLRQTQVLQQKAFHVLQASLES